MDSPSKITQDLLLANSFTNIYKSNMPDIDVGSCVYDTGGFPNDGTISKPTLQILHRNTDYEIGYATIQAIKVILDTYNNSDEIFGYTINGDINYIGTDSKSRYEWTINATALREGI